MAVTGYGTESPVQKNNHYDLSMMEHRKVSLTIRGFTAPVAKLSSAIAAKAVLAGTKGKPAREGVKTILKKSFLLYEEKISASMLWDDAIELIINKVGGVELLSDVKLFFSIEIMHIDISVPARTSDEQEGGYISEGSIAKLKVLGSSFGVSIL